ncbi:signal peptidase II [Candidatus Entotheonella serta]|nr:signal peptidase II [Candidatus Entotheonella serta]
MQTEHEVETAPPQAYRWKKWLLFIIVVGVVVALDQGTKQYVDATFNLYESRPVVEGFFNLTYVRNSGAAFGMLSRQDPKFLRLFFLTVTGLAVFIVTFYYSRLPWSHRLALWGLGLIMGGALGNGIDRYAIGQVIDFLDVYVGDYHWPAFNVADSAICIGVGLMLINSFRRPVEP